MNSDPAIKESDATSDENINKDTVISKSISSDINNAINNHISNEEIGNSSFNQNNFHQGQIYTV